MQKEPVRRLARVGARIEVDGERAQEVAAALPVVVFQRSDQISEGTQALGAR